jgi:8-oxo-dGTP pyrophosphatase MutT (NUDIX family)
MQDFSENEFQIADGVSAVATCTLKVVSDAWPFAEINAALIDVHWAEAKAANPRYFNGIVHLVCRLAVANDALDASLLRTDFKSYLYWRHLGYPHAGALDGFGSALMRTSDGHVILGRQGPGNVNVGLACLPAGFIDERDVAADGSIDIVRSVAREVEEETGLEGRHISREPGFIIARSGAQLSFAVPFHIAMRTADAVAFVDRHMRATPDSELEAVIPVAGLADTTDLAMPRYTSMLLEALFKVP